MGIAKFSKSRLSLDSIKFWLDAIKKSYDDNLAEQHTEFFLIQCDYVLNEVILDLLGTINYVCIVIQKEDHSPKDVNRIARKRPPYNFQEKEKITHFLKDYKNEFDKFQEDLVVQYFTVLRNNCTYSIHPHIYENQYVENKIASRRFSRNFNSFSVLGERGKQLLDQGGTVDLDWINGGSFLDKPPLSKLDKTQRTKLETILEETDPLELLETHFKNIERFVEYFGRKYGF